jgi:hypothetical protein
MTKAAKNQCEFIQLCVLLVRFHRIEHFDTTPHTAGGHQAHLSSYELVSLVVIVNKDHTNLSSSRVPIAQKLSFIHNILLIHTSPSFAHGRGLLRRHALLQAHSQLIDIRHRPTPMMLLAPAHTAREDADTIVAVKVVFFSLGMLLQALGQVKEIDINRELALLLGNFDTLGGAEDVGVGEEGAHVFVPVLAPALDTALLGGRALDGAGVAEVGRVDGTVGVEDFYHFGRTPAPSIEADGHDGTRQRRKQVTTRVSLERRSSGECTHTTISLSVKGMSGMIHMAGGSIALRL